MMQDTVALLHCASSLLELACIPAEDAPAKVGPFLALKPGPGFLEGPQQDVFGKKTDLAAICCWGGQHHLIRAILLALSSVPIEMERTSVLDLS